MYTFSVSPNKSQFGLALVMGHVSRGSLLAAAKAVVVETRAVIQWPICLEDRKWVCKQRASEQQCPQIPLYPNNAQLQHSSHVHTEKLLKRRSFLHRSVNKMYIVDIHFYTICFMDNQCKNISAKVRCRYVLLLYWWNLPFLEPYRIN